MNKHKSQKNGNIFQRTKGAKGCMEMAEIDNDWVSNEGSDKGVDTLITDSFIMFFPLPDD